MLHVVGIKNCNSVRKALSWIDDKEIDYEFIDLKKDPLSADELDELVHKVGLEVLVNRRGMTYRNLGLKDKTLTDQELQEVLLQNQMMIKRPVLIKDGAVLVGFDEHAYSEFLTDEE